MERRALLGIRMFRSCIDDGTPHTAFHKIHLLAIHFYYDVFDFQSHYNSLGLNGIKNIAIAAPTPTDPPTQPNHWLHGCEQLKDCRAQAHLLRIVLDRIQLYSDRGALR